MRRNTGEIVSHASSQSMTKGQGQRKKSLFASIHKPPVDDGKPRSLVIKKAHTMIPARIVAEAISTLHGDGLELRWSGPITPTEREFDLSRICVIKESPETMPDNKRKSPRGSLKSPRESCMQFAGSNLPDLDRTQLEPSRLLDILTKKCSFPGSFISIPEIQADAMVLVAESYPFYQGNHYMTILGEQYCIKGFAGYKESGVIPAPESWLDLRIKGSQLSQYFRKKSKPKLKGLFSYPAYANGIHHSLHWDHLNLMLHRPDLVLCMIDNSHRQTFNCEKENMNTSG
ncbi:hypothetical protein D8674_017804 [Pyrus ussuriensis x Pyrus communis]|uniref:Uncharacterized protein n=1 Tax=Pyrus ussuriensis x Pyrus communis TaxID=2448454 RepID=A0A5N5HRY6_9ROSA|nr:hypothetical protein D8674_017804 [Pyrus ussuriensis x Pyrus communis]